MAQPSTTSLPGSRQDLLPRIKHRNFLTAVSRMLQDEPGPASIPVSMPLAGDLVVSYAFDMPDMFAIVTEREREQLGLSLEELHACAVENLLRRLPKMKVTQHGSVIVPEVGENLEACLLLVDGFWRNMQSQLPGRLIVAPVHRDVLLFGCDAWPEGTDEMKQARADIQTKDPTHSLSEMFFTWDDGVWSTCEGGCQHEGCSHPH